MLTKFKSTIKNLNEFHFNIGYIILTIIVTILATQFGFVSAEIVAGILMKSATFVATSIIFLKSLMGSKYDALKEIRDDQNVALAIVLAGFMAGLGFSIGGL